MSGNLLELKCASPRRPLVHRNPGNGLWERASGAGRSGEEGRGQAKRRGYSGTEPLVGRGPLPRGGAKTSSGTRGRACETWGRQDRQRLVSAGVSALPGKAAKGTKCKASGNTEMRKKGVPLPPPHLLCENAHQHTYCLLGYE